MKVVLTICSSAEEIPYGLRTGKHEVCVRIKK